MVLSLLVDQSARLTYVTYSQKEGPTEFETSWLQEIVLIDFIEHWHVQICVLLLLLNSLQ